MNLLPRIIWLVYLLILGGTLWHRGVQLTSPESAEWFYFFFLYTYDPGYYWFYAAAVIHWTLTCVNVIPLLLYLVRRAALCRILWQILFLAMLSFNITGHHYHMKTVQAASQYKFYQGLLAVIMPAAVYIPLYILSFHYAFIRAWRKPDGS